MRRKALMGSSYNGGGGMGPPSEDSYVTGGSGAPHGPHGGGGLQQTRSISNLGSPTASFYDGPGVEEPVPLGARGRGRSFTNFRLSFDPSPHRPSSPMPPHSRGGSFTQGLPGGRSIRKVVPRPLARHARGGATMAHAGDVEMGRPSRGSLRPTRSLSTTNTFSLFPGTCFVWGGAGDFVGCWRLCGVGTPKRGEETKTRQTASAVDWHARFGAPASLPPAAFCAAWHAALPHPHPDRCCQM
jgi:hypothetical protein